MAHYSSPFNDVTITNNNKQYYDIMNQQIDSNGPIKIDTMRKSQHRGEFSIWTRVHQKRVVYKKHDSFPGVFFGSELDQ